MRANKWKGVRDSDFKFQWTEWTPSEEKEETRIGEGGMTSIPCCTPGVLGLGEICRRYF